MTKLDQLLAMRDQRLQATKPWLAQGISRSTWYRRRRAEFIALYRAAFIEQFEEA